MVKGGGQRGPDGHLAVLAARTGHDVATLRRTQRSHAVLVRLDGLPQAPAGGHVDEYRAVLRAHPDLQEEMDSAVRK